MIRVTVDTNALASGALAHTGAIAELIDAWRSRKTQFVISDHILMELEQTLRKPYFAARLDDVDRRVFLLSLIEFASMVEIVGPIPTVLPDHADNLVLATALCGKAAYLVTGDREMQRLGEYQGERIVSAKEFLDQITLGGVGNEGP